MYACIRRLNIAHFKYLKIIVLTLQRQDKPEEYKEISSPVMQADSTEITCIKCLKIIFSTANKTTRIWLKTCCNRKNIYIRRIHCVPKKSNKTTAEHSKNFCQ